MLLRIVPILLIGMNCHASSLQEAIWVKARLIPKKAVLVVDMYLDILCSTFHTLYGCGTQEVK
jgi:hypothetical protein